MINFTLGNAATLGKRLEVLLSWEFDLLFLTVLWHWDVMGPWKITSDSPTARGRSCHQTHVSSHSATDHVSTRTVVFQTTFLLTHGEQQTNSVS